MDKEIVYKVYCGCEYIISAAWNYIDERIEIDDINIHKFCSTHDPVKTIDPRILLFIRQMKLLSSAYHGRPNGANDCLCEFELLFPELKEAKDE